jgi:chromatin segregation and condensation protein Rec8/ScpA/Scc1 (kleisin family)
MSCKQWNDEWVAHLYDELEAEEQRRLAAHLERCADCRTTLDRLRASHQLLQEAAPADPATPRVVVLRPRPLASNMWAFAAGAAAALLLFAAGFWAGPRWTRPPSGPVAAQHPAQPAAETDAELQQDLLAMNERLARLENRPGTGNAAETASRAELQDELGRLERRVNQQRMRDLEYVVRSITASELRTGSWLDQTDDALTLLALRQDPSFSEQ